MNLRSIYKKHKRKKQLTSAAPYIHIDQSAVLGDNFNLDLRAPKNGATYLEIGEKSMIDSSFVFETESGHIKVGDRVLPVLQDKDWSVVKSAPIVIEDKVWMGFGVTILKGVTIGEGAVIGAGSVVTRDVAPYTVVAGNPAQVVKTLPR